jgi:sporulation protein YlmC with PRC-barrel domain
MKKIVAASLAAALLLPTAIAPVAMAQVKTETIAITRVDSAGLVNAHRASKVIGESVLNEAGDNIGRIDDLLVRAEGSNRVLFAVVSVGGFLGIGNKLVAVPYASLQTNGKGEFMLPGATKDALKNLPEFKYS